jgi:hypothetical protein
MKQKRVRETGTRLLTNPAPGDDDAARPSDPGRIDRARTRIAEDFYSRAHVRNRILKALLELLDDEEA